ncbi:DNA methyltransferase [Roseiflexus castenholzii]|uniref:DNA methyltransferase n=1 Tax=Roseiflexus castenholzii TaxID=120962 RepID=UPI003C7DA979
MWRGNAASRKYFTKDHLWYPPPPEIFIRMVSSANEYGDSKGRPYFSFDGKRPANQQEYEKLFPTFKGKYGGTNVWNHPPLHNRERVRLPGSRKYAHLHQKPVYLMELIIESSSHLGAVIWEPFGGLCTAGLVASRTSRTAYCAEIDEDISILAISRLKACEPQENLQSFEAFR